MRYLAVSAGVLLLGALLPGCCCGPKYYPPTYAAAQQPVVYAPQTLPQTLCQPTQTLTQPVCPPGTVPVQTAPGTTLPQAVR
ncbi:MAG: hypothetical protein HUU20_05055 [Pirellulales bacterium]|nr:hypothetical protein [Pirellulales bacterium]